MSGSLSGDHRYEETPVPIPNTSVKLVTADGSAATMWCESRLSPVLCPGFPYGEPGLFFGGSETAAALGEEMIRSQGGATDG